MLADLVVVVGCLGVLQVLVRWQRSCPMPILIALTSLECVRRYVVPGDCTSGCQGARVEAWWRLSWFWGDLPQHALVERVCLQRAVVDKCLQEWCCPDAAAFVSSWYVAVAGGIDWVL